MNRSHKCFAISLCFILISEHPSYDLYHERISQEKKSTGTFTLPTKVHFPCDGKILASCAVQLSMHEELMIRNLSEALLTNSP